MAQSVIGQEQREEERNMPLHQRLHEGFMKIKCAEPSLVPPDLPCLVDNHCPDCWPAACTSNKRQAHALVVALTA